jgi:cobalt-zinc-cadmium efflux system membrane fusion protein
MKYPALPIAASCAVLLLSCQRHDHPHGAEPGAESEAAHGHGHGDSSQSITHWTDKTELFVEFPALVLGQESAFAAHLTRLSDFKPVDGGRVIVVLSGGGTPEERFAIESPTVPGIFRPVARPKHAGARALSLLLESDPLSDAHVLGEVTVFPDADAAAHAAPSEPESGGGISFLKEQQWPIDFATAEATERTLRPSLAASGMVRARADGEVHVTAPVAGRLVTAGDAFPRIGAHVERDQVLVTLAPRLGGEVDLASLDLAAAKARIDLEHARRERERLEGLLAAGAVPERRVIAARRDEAQAGAELTAAQRRIEQHGRVQRADATGSAGAIAVRAPITGTLVAVDTAPGVFLDEGKEMFHIVDLERLWLEVRVPEANIGRADRPAGAWFEVEGIDAIFEVAGDRIVTTGGVVDARTRTVPLIFGIDNPERRLRVGMFARVHLLTGAPLTAVAVPETAVLEDGGQEVAYVQTEGETFERRVVRLGVRDGGYVEVKQGVSAGEHVVVRGAFMVKLAASATEAPAHGHAH